MAEAKSYIRTVKSGQEQLVIQALVGKGGWSFYILHQEKGEDKKYKTKARGATTTFPDLAAAAKAVDEAVAKAVAAGWSAPVASVGAQPKREDTFTLDALPKPGVAPAPAPKPAAPAPAKKEAQPLKK